MPTLSASAPSRTVRLSAYYDAASTTREADYGFWSAPVEEAQFTGGTRARVIARIRREIRNNPYLAGLVAKYPEAIGFSSLRSRTADRSYNKAKELFWYRWSKRVSIDGASLRTAEKVVIQELLVAGEVFVVLLASGLVQLIPSEFCGSPGDASLRAAGEVDGIVYGTAGTPISYRFGTWKDGSIQFTGDASELVDARFVKHVFDRDRVRMGRGLPWLLPSIRTARDLYEITRSKTKQIKDANSISGFIEKQGAADFLRDISSTPVPSEYLDPATGGERPGAPADPVPAAGAGPSTIDLAPGTFVGLEVGEKVSPLSSNYNASDYKELVLLMLHAIATPVGLPVELWFSGLGDVAYSGFKGLGAQWAGRRRYLIAFLEDRFLGPLHFWRISKAAKEGALPPNPERDDDLVEWGWRRSAILDDEKAAKSNQVRLASGESSLAEIWEENGQFADEVLEHRRTLYLRALVAAGQLDPDADTEQVEVPLSFLLFGQLAAAAGTPPASPFRDPAPAQPGDWSPSDSVDAPAASPAPST